jgi:hypothetical protein
MGQIAGCCLGHGEVDIEKKLQQDKRAANYGTSSKQFGGPAQSHADESERIEVSGEKCQSRPKAIVASGPIYAAGTFESKYKLLSVIGKILSGMFHVLNRVNRMSRQRKYFRMSSVRR